MEKITEAASLIVRSRKVMALTGAGISTDSGIPDFRSSNGYYVNMDPVKSLSKERLLYEPERFYQEGYVILSDLNDRQPNQGHLALTQLEELGQLQGVITQNIDNLHAKAGSQKIYEVHGETRGVHCLSCHAEFPFAVMRQKVESGDIPPHCDKCKKGVLRPNVVMFGDMMPQAFSDAMEELEDVDTLIVIGSSLTVSPVNYMPRYAKHLIIINKDVTPFDSRADVVIHENSTQVLPKLVDEVKKLL